MKKYTFRKYDKRFPKLFLKEKKRLLKILPTDSEIEHVGSTSVPGLGGKGIIDVIIGINKKDISNVKKLLEENKYNWIKNAGDRNRIFFQKDYGFLFKRRVHLHLTNKRSIIWKKHIALRNFLRVNKKIAKKYEELKKKAVKYSGGIGEKYRNYKNKFIVSLLKKALK